MKYILVTGGVISGIGKEIIASSVGTILQSCGLHVTSIKIDPYINIDAGTLSSYEHGEVFVLDDGGEVDLDLGNYERFLDIRLTKDNNLTTGKIYQYEWVMRQALIPADEDGLEPQVCVIELGGTVGGIESMPFIEFQFKVKRDNFCNIHVSLVPQPSSTGEQKTKRTQNSVRELRGLGLSPDLVVCRCSNLLGTSVKEKISMFCHVEPEQVICVHYVSSIYRVPLLLEEQGVVDYFLRRLDLPIERQPRKMLMKWKEMADRYNRLLETCSTALVGKYTKFSDSYASVIKALEHSALAINHKLEIKSSVVLMECWFQEDLVFEEQKEKSKQFPGLGIRKSLFWAFASECKTCWVGKILTLRPVILCGTMRLGKRRTLFQTKNSVMRKLYGDADYLEERHSHRFEVNPVLKKCLEEQGLKFVGQDVEGERMEIVELEDHPCFVGVQYHPEFLSRPIKLSPPYFGLLLASVGKLPHYLQKGCRLSPRDTYSDRSGSSTPDSEITDLKFLSINHD
uniref:CTP synthase n=1 Tax=Aotus nancymaae TaxID=37293 RepID=A0A2K5D9N6_AOTNA